MRDNPDKNGTLWYKGSPPTEGSYWRRYFYDGWNYFNDYWHSHPHSQTGEGWWHHNDSENIQWGPKFEGPPTGKEI